jgi:putative hemolysin
MDSLPSGFWLKIGCITFSLCTYGLFSFLETAITALRIFNLKQLAKKTGTYKNLFIAIEKEPQRVLIALLIASCLASVISVDLVTDFVQHGLMNLGLSSGLSFFLSVAVATATFLIFGEIIPKNVAQLNSEKLLESTLWIANITFYIMTPLVSLLSVISNFFVSRFSPQQKNQENSLVSEREIRFLINHINKKGEMDTDKSQMLHGIFELADKTIKEIMVPEIDVITLNVKSSLEQALAVFAKYHFSRLPVYEGKEDNIVGMVHQKDLFLLLSKKEERPLKELVRPLLFVPESMKVNQLLRQFKQQRHHIAMVLSEYGSIIGLVTLEDTLEEIVGDINDEHESVAEPIVPLEQGGWLVYAGVDLETLSEKISITFKVEDAITLGGFLTERLQHLPKKGEKFQYKDYTFQVQKATPKRVIQVLIFKKEDA